MYILNSNFSFLKQVGDISAEKLNELKKVFNDYPEFIANSGQPLILRKGVSAIVIQGNQLTYVIEGHPGEINVGYIVQELARLNDILNLPLESAFALRVEAIKEYDIDVMKKSSEIFGQDLNPLTPKGIGYRFIIEEGHFHGDIHVEPYLKDQQRAYFNIILNSSSNININSANEYVNELFNFAIINTEVVADALYKK